MAAKKYKQPNLLIVGQAGRLEYEAVIFMATLRAHSPDFTGRVIIAEPAPEGAWDGVATQISDACREVLTGFGAEILPFVARHFGAAYPQGNKIEALALLPPKQPFVFFDTDTLITGALDRVRFDFTKPSASMRRQGTWPTPPLYGPGYSVIWQSVYDRFGVPFAGTQDVSQPDEHWERYLYFNAGWFFGADPAEFGRRFLEWSLALRDDPHDELACQVLEPWLDQVILPVVIHSLGGGRPGPELSGLDGDVTCHYRKLPLLYAQHADAAIQALETAVADKDIKRVLREWEPARKLVYQDKGRQIIRPIFADRIPPAPERMIRNQLKARGWWLV